MTYATASFANLFLDESFALKLVKISTIRPYLSDALFSASVVTSIFRIDLELVLLQQ